MAECSPLPGLRGRALFTFNSALAARHDLPADFLRVGFFPVQAEGFLVPGLGLRLLLERKPVFVGAVHVVEGHGASLLVTPPFLTPLCYSLASRQCAARHARLSAPGRRV